MPGLPGSSGVANAFGADDIDIRVILRDELSRPAHNVRRNLRGVGDDATIAAEQLAFFDREAAEAGRQLEELAAQNRLAQHELSRTERQARRTGEALAGERLAGVGAGGDGGGGGLGGGGRRGGRKKPPGFGKALGDLFKIPHFFTAIKFGSIADGLNQVVAGVNALAGAGAAVVSDLAPMSGMLIAYPGMALAAAQGFGVLKIATHGLGAAIKVLTNPKASAKEVAAAIKDLGPNARSAALAVANLNKPFKSLVKTVQEKALSGLAPFIKGLGNQWIPILTTQLSGTAGVMNGLIKDFGHWAASGSTVKNMTDIMSANNIVIGHMGRGLLKFVDIFVNLIHDALPMLRAMSESFEHLGDTLDKKVVANGDKLTAFFTKAFERFKVFAHIIANFASGMFVIFKVASGWSESMNSSLTKVSQKFKDWANSAKGKTSIEKFFEQAHKNVEAIGRVLKALARGWKELSTRNGGAFEKAMDNLANLIPKLVNFIQSANGGFISNLLKIAGAVIQFAESLGGAKPLAITLSVVTPLIKGFFDFLTALPDDAKKILAYGVAILVLSKRVKALKTAFVGTKFWKALGAGWRIFSAALAEGNTIQAASWRVLTAAMKANPLLFWLTIITLLAIAVFEIIKHWSTVKKWLKHFWHDIVNWAKDAWKWIKKYAKFIALALAILFGPIGLLIGVLLELGIHWRTIWNHIKSWSIAAWHFLDNYVIHPLVHFFADILPSALSKTGRFFVRIWDDIKSGVGKAWDWLNSNVFQPIWHFFRDDIWGAVQKVGDIFSSVFDSIKGVIQDVWKIIQPILDTMKGAIDDVSGAVGSIAHAAGNVGHAVGNVAHAGHNVLHAANPLNWEHGGSLRPGFTHIVGERGVEAILDKTSGTMRLVGMWGPEVFTSRQPHYVMPYATDGSLREGTAPAWARRALDRQRVFAGATVARRGVPGASPADDDLTLGDLPPINQYIYPQTAFDYRRQMKRALKDYNRDRRERGAKR